MTEPTPTTALARTGRRVVAVYLGLCAIALIAMAVETVTGHAGTATMFAAFLAVPWSMLVAGLAPPLPRDWPMAAGLAVRMAPLALFMLLNAAIISGIAGRSGRDVASRSAQLGLLALLAACGLLGSGCSLTTRQAVFVGTPVQTLQTFEGGHEETKCVFDLSTSEQWVKQHGDIVRITDLTIMGDFQGGTAPVEVKIVIEPDPLFAIGPAVDTWGPVRVDSGTKHVDWSEGQRLMLGDASTLAKELRGDGEFEFFTESTNLNGTLSSSEVHNLRLAAVFELK
jgi:hypothetical protein